MLSDSEKQFLLRLARQSIECAVLGQNMPTIKITQPALREQSGAFVTLHEDHELRGCIGYVDAIKPLFETVQEAAAKAALDDPRFSPVSPEELAQVEIEISVLSPLKTIRSIDEIEIGKHGLVAELGHYRGLLLPQVATSAGWDKRMFVQQTLRKSGIPHDLWHHNDLKIFSFTAEIFSEHTSSEL